MHEIELKFLLDAVAATVLKARLRASKLRLGKTRTRSLRSVYFDTPDHQLRKAGIALRLRRDGRRWIQTVKAGAELHGGLSQVTETECPAPGGRINLIAIPDAAVRDEVIRLVGDASLAPVCETAIERLSVRLSPADGAMAELAIDSGEILAGGRSAPLHEAEIELVEGQAGILFDLAHALFPEGGLRFSRLPKSARGYLLAEQGYIEPPLAPRSARTVPIEASQTVETAARDVLRECVDQIASNMIVVRELDDPEGPHQLRIGLRRLRSALSVFGDVLASLARDNLAAEARWLGQEVGELRDLDVAIHDVLRPEAEANEGEAGLGLLADRLALRAETQRVDLRVLLVAPRAQALLIELARFVETRGWLNPDDIAQTARLAVPIAEFAGEALRKRRKKVAGQAKHLDELTGDERHELRKDLKKLRYAVEFLSPLYREKRVGPYVKRLKSLQTIFGEANDAEMLQGLLDDPSRGLPGDRDLAGARDLQRATGWAIGSARARAEIGWVRVKAVWRDLKDARAFWK